MWEDSVGILNENRACGYVHFNLIHATFYTLYIMYLYLFRELCLSVGDVSLCFYSIVGFFLCFYLYLMFLFFLFLMDKGFWWQREWKLNQKTIIKLLFFISINGKKQTVMIEHDKLAFDQRAITDWWKGVLDDNYWQFFSWADSSLLQYLFDLTKAKPQNERKNKQTNKQKKKNKQTKTKQKHNTMSTIKYKS